MFKMKLLIIVLFFVRFVLTQDVVGFSQYMSKCICATDVNQAYAYDWLNNYKLVNDPCFKCFLNCMAISVGIIDSQGNYYEDVLFKILPNLNKTAVDLCGDLSANERDPCQKNFEITRCIQASIV
ncbi:hypothetical protein FQR65_LT05778 [Abscondita terminalis]|nr:hypothetical protein FQR65_LT05778 [Abscondita terminalis]